MKEIEMLDAEQQPSEMEVLRKLEDEHLRLQRQIRMIQLDREQRTMGVHPQFRRQDLQLRILKREYINMIMDLKIAKSGAHKKNDKIMRREVKRAILLQMQMQKNYQDGVDHMGEMDGLIQNNNKNVLALRSLVETSQGKMLTRRKQSEHNLSSMENKLEVAINRFNVVQHENKKIREKIEHMLKDRANFNLNWEKMLTALQKGKKFLQDLFESSTVAYDQRDDWVRKLRSIQEKGKIEQSLQVQEMRDIQKMKDHEMRLHDFLATKGVMRINRKQEEREVREKKEKEEKLEKEIEIHEKILEDVFEYTEEDDIEKITDGFTERENHNFSTYLMTVEYCASNEFLQRELVKLKQELVDRSEWNDFKDNERQNKLQRLRCKLEEQTIKLDEYRDKEKTVDSTIKNTMEQIDGIFKLLKCSLEPYQNLLGDKTPSVWNLNMTFRLITEQIIDLVNTAYYCERQKQYKEQKSVKSRYKKYLIHAKAPKVWSPAPMWTYIQADPCSNCVEARWLSRFTETIEPPFDRDMTLQALTELRDDPAYEKSDRLHPLNDCRLPKSRLLLAKRYM